MTASTSMISAAPASLPAPKPDPLNAPFWELARERLLGLQRCTACGDVRFPAAPVCPRCLSDAQEWTVAGGSGTLFSWCRFHRAYWDGVTTLVPYPVAMVRLDEGPVLMTRLVGVSDFSVLQLGMPVEVRFEATAGDFTLPVFALSPASSPKTQRSRSEAP